MRRSRTKILGASVMVGVTAAAFWAMAASRGEPRTIGNAAMISTPPGITMQPLGKAQGYGMDSTTAAVVPRDQIVYADARGMTVYTNDNDQPGKSLCIDECARTWPPLAAPANAKPYGPWSAIRRDDGTSQWALNGKPLYTHVKDEDPGSVGGNTPKRFGRGPHIGERGRMMKKPPPDVPMPAEWHAAMHVPVQADALPPGFAVAEVSDAMGLVLVNAEGRTLYVFVGDPNKDAAACGKECDWRPVGAPQVGLRIGKFAPLLRTDGRMQWTYEGFGLYTYNGDLMAGDANGDRRRVNWEVAYVARNFVPDGISVQTSGRLGKVIATKTGQTLYGRDSYILQSGSGHTLRRGIPLRPAVGRDLGPNARCLVACDKFHPFLAPADAVAQGYWDVYDRGDGTKQWGYHGYALWIYDGDTKPGDINAQDWWDITTFAKYEDTKTLIDIGTQYDGVASLYWSAALP